MSFLHDPNILILIIILLVVLLIVAIIFIITQKELNIKDSESSSRGTVSREKFNLIFNQKNAEYQEKIQFEDLYNNYKKKYEEACVEIGKLKRKIDELTRDYNELNELYNKDSFPNERDEKIKASSPTVEHSIGHEKTKESIEGITKYASFPRSAGSSIYFSDLTDKLVDDSYFELRISSDTGKASFRPLDFMKIRNYDPAMAAILTDGVKPNVASTIVSIEPGEAYLEGNDWIIIKLAKIKLA